MSDLKSQREHIRQEQLRRIKQRNIIFLIGGLAVIVLALLAFVLPKLGGSAERYQNQAGFSVGDPNAPVKVEEYSNFTCSHCRTFALDTEADFINKYVDTGKVYLTFRNFPFQNDTTANAVEATYCAEEQNAVWQLKHKMFQFSSYSGGFADSNLIKYAGEIGMDTKAFKDCLDSNRFVPQIAAAREYAIGQKIEFTPSFVVNGQINFSDTLETAVDSELAALGQ